MTTEYFYKYLSDGKVKAANPDTDVLGLKGIELGGFEFNKDNIALKSELESASGLLIDYINADPLEERVIVGVDGQTSVSVTGFTWSSSVSSTDILVFKNGVKQKQSPSLSGYDFYKTSDSQLEFSTPLISQDRIDIIVGAPAGGGGGGGGGGGSGDITNGQNLGIGSQVFKQKSGASLQFRTLVAGSNVSISTSGDTIVFDASASGEANTASNLGSSGAGNTEVFSTKVGVDLRFRRLKQGNNVTLSQDANYITIDSSGGGSANFEKIMQSSHGSTIAMGKPVSKKSDGSIVPADSDSADGFTFCGIAKQDILPSATGYVYLPGPNIAGAVSGLGFTVGGKIFISENGGYVQSTSGFTGGDDYIIRIGIADCASGSSSAVATDIIFVMQYMLSP